MSTLSERNKIACKKSYEKKKLLELASKFEHYCVEKCIEQYKHSFYHWSNVPHEWLYACGYINDYNTHRKKILQAYLEKNPIRDIGVDFVGKASEHFIAGQSKLYTGKVPYTDTCTWFAKVATMRMKSPLNTGVLCTVSGIVEETWEDIQVQNLTHMKLERTNFENWAKTFNKKVEKIYESNIILRDYQKECVKLAIKHKKTILHMTCALGKTVIMGNIVSKKRPKCILAMAPIRSEVNNLYERLPCFLPDCEIFLLDSDGSTDLSKLIEAVKKCIKDNKSMIIFTTYISATNILSEYLYGNIETDEDEDEEYFVDDDLESDELINDEQVYFDDSDQDDLDESDEDEDEDVEDEDVEENECKEFLRNSLLIADEVHQIHPNKKKLIALLNRSKEALYATATLPSRFKKIIKYDHIIDKYDFPFALKNKLIVDYQIMIPLKLQPCESLEDVYKIDNTLSNNIKQKASCLWKGMLQTGSRRCIVYLSTKEECHEFICVFKKIGEEYHGRYSETFRVNDDINASQRKEIFTIFDSGEFEQIKIIATCQCLNQAVNLVRCDSTFICSISQSTSEIVMFQRFMRGARIDTLNPSKKNTCFIWCNDEDSNVLEECLTKLKKEMKDDCFNDKVRVFSQTYESQEKKEIKVKKEEEEKNIEGYLIKWISVDEKIQIYKKALLEYAIINNKVPSLKETIKINNKTIKVGHLWTTMKQGFNKELREELYNQSEVYKKDYERYLKEKKNKEEPPTNEEKKQALLEHVKIYKKVPSRKKTFKINNKTINVGQLWNTMKQSKSGQNKELREEICNENIQYNKEYEIFLSKKEDKEEPPTNKEKKQALLEYIRIYKKVPTQKETFKINNKIIKIGNLWEGMKQDHNKFLREEICNESEVYKKDYERYLKEKENREEPPTNEEKKQALLEHVKIYKKVPSYKEPFKINNKTINIGSLWTNIKNGKNKELREEICDESEVYKKDYERYLKEKKNREDPSTNEEKKQALLEYVRIYKKVPSRKETFKINNKTINIGSLWNSMKSGKNKELREEICNHSEVYKIDYETFLDKKEDKEEPPINEEKKQALLEYVRIYKKVPSCREIFKINNKTINVGQMWTDMKSGKNKELREEIYNHSEIYKTDYERYLKAKVSRIN